ncbi:MAG: hypothetical protein LUE98_10325 [Tannerellaceae bacterium]|nr:hypothetical protein [Tannerellaceae bacterium]
MKQTKKCILAVILILSFSCTRPRYFTNHYTGEYTGLDTLINIEGFYYFERDDSSNINYCIMFHEDGLFIYTHVGKPSDSLTNYFEGYSRYPGFCGTYYIDKDTLKTQGIINRGWMYGVFVIFKDYYISPVGELSFIREYILEDRLIGSGNLNKRNFRPDNYLNPGTFFPLDIKDHRCRYIKKKWFTGKK